MEKSVLTYYRNNKLYIAAQFRDNDHIWRANDNVFIIPDDNIEQITAAILDCLSRSGYVATTYTLEKANAAHKEFNKILGVRSFSQFMKGAKCVNITQKGNEIKFLPTQNDGPKGGFVPIDESIIVSVTSLSSLGSELLKAYTLSV